MSPAVTAILVYMDRARKNLRKIRLGDRVRAVYLPDAESFNHNPSYLDGTVKRISLATMLVHLTDVTIYMGPTKKADMYDVNIGAELFSHFEILGSGADKTAARAA